MSKYEKTDDQNEKEKLALKIDAIWEDIQQKSKEVQKSYALNHQYVFKRGKEKNKRMRGLHYSNLPR